MVSREPNFINFLKTKKLIIIYSDINYSTIKNILSSKKLLTNNFYYSIENA